jgi:hypothetical protein
VGRTQAQRHTCTAGRDRWPPTVKTQRSPKLAHGTGPISRPGRPPAASRRGALAVVTARRPRARQRGYPTVRWHGNGGSSTGYVRRTLRSTPGVREPNTVAQRRRGGRCTLHTGATAARMHNDPKIRSTHGPRRRRESGDPVWCSRGPGAGGGEVLT